MNSHWPIVPFSELFQRVERKLIIDDGTEYQRIGVRWYGNGAFIRDSAFGIDIARKQQWIVEKGDVIYNKLFAWKGAFAIADESVHGHIASDKFPTYRQDSERLDLDYLKYYFQTPTIAKQAESLSRGAAAISKLTLNPPQFWDLSIPLPPLAEQRQIVGRIEALVGKVEEARRLRETAQQELKALKKKVIDTLITQATTRREKLESLLAEPLLNGLSLPSAMMGTGITFAKVGVVNTGVFNPKEVKLADIDLKPDSPYWLRTGDMVISRGNTPELVGRAAVYEGNPSNCAIPDLLIRARFNTQLANAKFISLYFHSSEARKYMESQVTGTSPTMKKISQPKLKAMPVPGLALSEQEHILEILEDLNNKMDAIRRFQISTQQELDALLPSILDRAFKGEL